MSPNFFAFWYECLVRFFTTLRSNIVCAIFCIIYISVIHIAYFTADKVLRVNFIEFLIFTLVVLTPLVMFGSSFMLNLIKFPTYPINNLLSKTLINLKNFFRSQFSSSFFVIILIILLEKTPELINSIPVFPSFGYIQDFLKLFTIVAALFGLYFLLFRFVFIIFIVSEKRISTLDSLKISDDMTNGHKMIMYIFYILVSMIPALFISSLNVANDESILIFRSLFDLMFIGMVITGFDKLRAYKHINVVN